MRKERITRRRSRPQLRIQRFDLDRRVAQSRSGRQHESARLRQIQRRRIASRREPGHAPCVICASIRAHEAYIREQVLAEDFVYGDAPEGVVMNEDTLAGEPIALGVRIRG